MNYLRFNQNVKSTDIEPANESLLYFQSALFASVLEDTLTELRILVECNSELRVIKAKIDWTLLLAHKFSIKQPAPELVDELEGVDYKNLGKDEYKLNKIINDRNFVTKVLLDTYLDLSINRCFDQIIECNNVLIDTDNHRVALVDDEAKNKINKRELFKQLRLQRIHIKSVTYDTDHRIDDLKSQIEDRTLITETSVRYITKWQRSRAEQNTQVIMDKEIGPIERINFYKSQYDNEMRVHYEVEQILNIKINDTLNEVESWMSSYDKDMEAIDLKIQIMKNNHQNAVEKRQNLEKVFADHSVLMKNWINFKDEREKARLYREKMTNAALCVQAWWRGFIVRQQLGPYKPQKKGGKKKK